MTLGNKWTDQVNDPNETIWIEDDQSVMSQPPEGINQITPAETNQNFNSKTLKRTFKSY